MTRLLFLVHGMGQHDEGWSGGAVKSLNDAGRDTHEALAGRYPNRVIDRFTFGAGADAEVRIHEIRYGSTFDRYLGRGARSADEVLTLAEQLQVDLGPAGGFLTWLATGDDEKRSFFQTHVADVLLFYCFPDVRKEVTENVVGQLVQGIEDATSLDGHGRPAGEIVRPSVLAHGLGTAVAQHALLRLASRDLRGNSVFTAAAGYHFGLLAMVANVSRVLEHEDVYRSIVGPPQRPGFDPAYWYVDAYHSIRHELDPFTLYRPFDRTAAQWGPSYWQPPALRHFLSLNPHDLSHYLAHPAVHLPLFVDVYNAAVVPREYIREQMKAYQPTPPNVCLAEMQRLAGEARAIIERHRAEQNVWGFCKAAIEFLVLVQELSDDCPTLASTDFGD